MPVRWRLWIRPVGIPRLGSSRRRPSTSTSRRSQFSRPLLRVYEGCARSYLGAVEDANIIKLYRRESKVSYLCYPDFDRDPHPGLHKSVNVCLRSFKVRARHYDDNRPILHRKELFVAPSYPRRGTFARLTAQEERYGLYEGSSAIARSREWDALVAGAGFRYRGHRMIKSRRLASIAKPMLTTPAIQ